MISSHTDANSLSARLRRRRMRYLDEAILRMDRGGLALADIGGTLSFWEMNLIHLEHRDRLAHIDVYNLETELPQEFVVEGLPVRVLHGDATHMRHLDDIQYDLAFSNSVIEHVGNLSCQHRFANEIRRVARAFVVQTPCRCFPLEPHFYVPFFQHLPLGLRTWLHRRFRLGWFGPEPDELQARIDCDEIRLLSRRELRLLFPDCAIEREHVAGMIKSFIVVGTPASRN